jgi:hypothetical protein
VRQEGVTAVAAKRSFSRQSTRFALASGKHVNRPERALGGWDSGSGGIAINHYQVGKPPFVFGIRSIDPAKAECVPTELSSGRTQSYLLLLLLPSKNRIGYLQTFEFSLLLTPNQTGKRFY